MSTLQAWTSTSTTLFALLILASVIYDVKTQSTTDKPGATTDKPGPTPKPIAYPDGNGPTTTTPPPTPNPTSLTTPAVTDDYELYKKRLSEFAETFGKKK